MASPTSKVGPDTCVFPELESAVSVKLLCLTRRLIASASRTGAYPAGSQSHFMDTTWLPDLENIGFWYVCIVVTSVAVRASPVDGSYRPQGP